MKAKNELKKKMKEIEQITSSKLTIIIIIIIITTNKYSYYYIFCKHD